MSSASIPAVSRSKHIWWGHAPLRISAIVLSTSFILYIVFLDLL